MTATSSAAPAVAVPLVAERAALAGTLPGRHVVRTGMGRGIAVTQQQAAGRLVVGLAGGVDPRVRPGDLVVATEVRGPHGVTGVPSAPLLAGTLRRLGLTVHLGPVESRPALTTGAARRALVGTGVLAVDMESAALVPAAGPFAVVRVVVDTDAAPLLHPGALVRGARALRTLRRAAPAFDAWVAAAGAHELLLAEPRSFCAGVRRAIEVVERLLDRHGPPVYVRRQVVHNAHVIRDLEARGAVFVHEVDEVPEGALVVLSAHGVAPTVPEQAAARDLTVVDATCPLVTKVHTETRRFAGDGDTVFLIGHREHEEVEGTLGEAPAQVVVVRDEDEARRVEPADPARVAYVTQTTLAVDEAEQVAAVLRDRFPALRGPRSDDVCYATTNRQEAVRAACATADLVLVVGSANSSNSRRLVEVAQRAGCPAHLVEDAGEVDLRWLAGAHKIALTAGASAPPHLVDELAAALAGLGPVSRQTLPVTQEDVRFTLPREVR